MSEQGGYGVTYYRMKAKVEDLQGRLFAWEETVPGWATERYGATTKEDLMNLVSDIKEDLEVLHAQVYLGPTRS